MKELNLFGNYHAHFRLVAALFVLTNFSEVRAQQTFTITSTARHQLLKWRSAIRCS